MHTDLFSISPIEITISNILTFEKKFIFGNYLYPLSHFLLHYCVNNTHNRVKDRWCMNIVHALGPYRRSILLYIIKAINMCIKIIEAI